MVDADDQFDLAQQGTVTAGGTLVITIAPTEPVEWVLTQVTNEMLTAPPGASCFLRKDGSLISPLIATGDAAADFPPVRLWPGQRATVEWASCTPGDIGKVLVIYNRLDRRTGRRR